MRACRHRLPLIIALITILVTGPLAGCGQKGDLYLPDKEKQDQPRRD